MPPTVRTLGGGALGAVSLLQLVQRRVVHGGRALRVGYVEAVAVAPSHRRRGLGSAVMAVLEEALRQAYEAGALSATDDGELTCDRRDGDLW
jgi:aminoglycoside 2'-N-acetyltransferase I